MDPQLAEMLEFLRSCGEAIAFVGFWASLPVIAFLIWCMLPKNG